MALADVTALRVLDPRVPFTMHSTAGEAVDLHAAGLVRAGAGFRPADPDLAGLVILDFGAFDAWYEEDELNVAHPRDPFHRIDVLPSSRQVRLELDGQVLAVSSRPVLLFETMLPTRYYLPRADVTAELVPSSTRTWCAYKGQASYFSASVGGRIVPDIAWSYPDPQHDAARVRDLIAFFDERIDVVLDGERRARPVTPWSESWSEPAGVTGDTDRVDAVARADLADRVGQVVAHGGPGQRQLGGDLRRSGCRSRPPGARRSRGRSAGWRRSPARPRSAPGRSPARPAATRRTPSARVCAGASLMMKRRTCTFSARSRLPGWLSPVSMRIWQPGTCSCSCPAAVRPSRPGRSMSSTATSGRVHSAVGTIVSPRSSSATTSMSASSDSRATRAPRIMCMSSAISTRIT